MPFFFWKIEPTNRKQSGFAVNCEFLTQGNLIFFIKIDAISFATIETDALL